MSDTIITIAQLREHASEASCYLPVNGKVYDVTKFLKFHPGGKQARPASLLILSICDR